MPSRVCDWRTIVLKSIDAEKGKYSKFQSIKASELASSLSSSKEFYLENGAPCRVLMDFFFLSFPLTPPPSPHTAWRSQSARAAW